MEIEITTKKLIIILLVLALIIFAVGSFLYVNKLNESKQYCGDGICEQNENCAFCSSDCKCLANEICDKNKFKCVLNITASICGNSVVEAGENCFDCPRDVKCLSDEYCDTETKSCKKASCGNGICEPYESTENCCLDCTCTSEAYICSNITLACEFPPFPLSDEKVKEMVVDYFNKRGRVAKIDKIEMTVYLEKEAVKGVSLYLDNEEIIYYVVVRQNGELVEMSVW